MSSPRATVTVNFELRTNAACQNWPTDLFFPEPPEVPTYRSGRPMTARNVADPAYRAQIDTARTVCASCPVRWTCLAGTLDMPDELDHGILGGLTEKERARLRRDPRRARFTRAMANLEHARQVPA